MPIQELAPATLSEVLRDIELFEDQYQTTSADFLNIGTTIADDDAAEWRYLLEQKEALTAEAKARILKSVCASVVAKTIVYSLVRSNRRFGESVEDRRQQYDCAA